MKRLSCSQLKLKKNFPKGTKSNNNLLWFQQLSEWDKMVLIDCSGVSDQQFFRHVRLKSNTQTSLARDTASNMEFSNLNLVSKLEQYLLLKHSTKYEVLTRAYTKAKNLFKTTKLQKVTSYQNLKVTYCFGIKFGKELKFSIFLFFHI